MGTALFLTALLMFGLLISSCSSSAPATGGKFPIRRRCREEVLNSIERATRTNIWTRSRRKIAKTGLLLLQELAQGLTSTIGWARSTRRDQGSLWRPLVWHVER